MLCLHYVVDEDKFYFMDLTCYFVSRWRLEFGIEQVVIKNTFFIVCFFNLIWNLGITRIWENSRKPIFWLHYWLAMPGSLMDGWMTYCFSFFNSISVISGWWADNNERQYAMENHLRLRRFHLKQGLNLGQPSIMKKRSLDYQVSKSYFRIFRFLEVCHTGSMAN